MRSQRTLLSFLSIASLLLVFAAPASADFGVERMWGKDAGLGGLGLGSGQLLRPEVAAHAPNGEIYVSEAEDCSIQVYSAAGEPLRRWGGACAEFMSDPDKSLPVTGIAVDDRNRVWLNEGSSGRISVRDSEGRLIQRFGASEPTFNGFFGFTFSIDVKSTPTGVEVFLADNFKHRVAKLVVADPAPGAPLTAELGWVAGIDVDANNPGTGYEVCTVLANCKDGASSAVPGSLTSTSDVDLTPDGAKVFANGNFRYAVELDAATGALLDANDLGAFNARQIAPVTGGGYWVAHYGGGPRLYRYDADGVPTGAQIGTPTPSAAAGNFGDPLDVTSNTDSDLLVTDVEMHRATLFNSTGADLLMVGKNDGIGWQRGSGDGEFALPRDVAATPTGGMWVADSENNRISGFDSAGDPLASNSAATSGTLGGQYQSPSGIAVNTAGTKVYVADLINRRIQQLSIAGGGAPVFERAVGKDVVTGGSTGSEICTVAADCKAGLSSAGAGEFTYPLDVEVSPFNGEVAVVDSTSGNRIQFFDANLNYMRTVESLPSAFSGPTAIAFEPSTGNFWVVDQLNGRVGRFQPDGVFLGWFQIHGLPTGISVVGSELHVSQAGTGQVSVFGLDVPLLSSWPPLGTPKPDPIRTYGAIGSNKGQLYKPERIAAANGDVLVADAGNNRVVRFGDGAAAADNQVQITSPADGTTFWNQDSVVVEYTATDSDGNALTCSPDDGSVVKFSGSGVPTTITVSCDDPLSDAAVTDAVTVTGIDDLEAPVIGDLSPANGSTTTSASATLSYSVSDTDPDPDCTPSSGSALNFTPGANTFSVTCTDGAGNSATASSTVTYTPLSPPATTPDPVCAVKFGKKYKFKGKVNATVTCDLATSVTFAVTAKVGRKKYTAKTTVAVEAGGVVKVSVKYPRKAAAAIKSGYASRKKPKLSYTLVYHAKQGASGAVKNVK